MIDGALIFIAGIVFGGAFWVPAAWNYFRRCERPKVELKLTPEVLDKSMEVFVMDWADVRGLMLQPKGIDFKPKVKR